VPKSDRKTMIPPKGEQKGLVTDVIVPLGQAAVAGGVGAAVANQLGKPKDKS
jgi:hypothetical protein